MPVKKPAAAKKTAAAKSAAPALAKKVSAAKKSAPAKSEASNDNADDSQLKATVEKIVNHIKDGVFDGFLVQFDDSLTQRLNIVNAQNASAAKKTAAAPKKVTPAPKRAVQDDDEDESVGVVTPVANTTYLVSKRFKPLADAKVKFVRFKTDSEDKKVVAEMMTDKPGNPKGKRVIFPTEFLVEIPKTAKKAPARKK